MIGLATCNRYFVTTIIIVIINVKYLKVHKNNRNLMNWQVLYVSCEIVEDSSFIALHFNTFS